VYQLLLPLLLYLLLDLIDFLLVYLVSTMTARLVIWDLLYMIHLFNDVCSVIKSEWRIR
jgi:hypothetical protein